jgi:hypothetical protein
MTNRSLGSVARNVKMDLARFVRHAMLIQIRVSIGGAKAA